MITDFHTHVAPDKIAARVEEGLRKKGLPLRGPMTLSGLKNHMRACGILSAITFCVAEKASVVKPANDFIMGLNDGKSIHGFGTVLPDIEDPRAEVRRLRDNGIKGIKFHALFQEQGACDESMFPVYEEMGDDMVAVFHSGRDPSELDKPARTTPEGIARIKSLFPKLKIVAAHLGGHDMLDDVKKHILGKDIYLDTSWTPDIRTVAPDVFMDIVGHHDTKRILFGTDYPTVGDPVAAIEWLKRLPLSNKDKVRIFHDNAAELLMSR